MAAILRLFAAGATPTPKDADKAVPLESAGYPRVPSGRDHRTDPLPVPIQKSLERGEGTLPATTIAMTGPDFYNGDIHSFPVDRLDMNDSGIVACLKREEPSLDRHFSAQGPFSGPPGPIGAAKCLSKLPLGRHGPQASCQEPRP